MRRVRVVTAVLLGLILASFVVAQITFRLLINHSPQTWHIEPAAASEPDSANFDFVLPPDAPEFTVDAATLRQNLERVMETLPRTELIASTDGDLHTTWVSTSALMAFPDYTSIRIVPTESGSTIEIFARARFGSGDLGVNKDRNMAIIVAMTREAGE